MGINSAIEWTDHTFNPWSGCAKVHEGCAHCYAEVNYSVKMRGVKWGPHGTRVRAADATWQEPFKWNRRAEKEGVRHRVFCASLADVFEDWQGAVLDHQGRLLMVHPGIEHRERYVHLQQGDDITIRDACNGYRLARLDDLRRDLFALIDATPNLDWLLLTKRPENVLRMWPMTPGIPSTLVDFDEAGTPQGFKKWERPTQLMHRPNVWLGTSISLQAHADEQIPALLECRDLAPVLFLSCEPLLGPVNMVDWSPATMSGDAAECFHDWLSDDPRINWVIVGGESGHHARPMHPDWARSLRDQCVAAGVPFFFKQWGEWLPPLQDGASDHPRFGQFLNCSDEFDRVGKKAAGRLLDGREWSQFPLTERANA